MAQPTIAPTAEINPINLKIGLMRTAMGRRIIHDSRKGMLRTADGHPKERHAKTRNGRPSVIPIPLDGAAFSENSDSSGSVASETKHPSGGGAFQYAAWPAGLGIMCAGAWLSVQAARGPWSPRGPGPLEDVSKCYGAPAC